MVTLFSYAPYSIVFYCGIIFRLNTIDTSVSANWLVQDDCGPYNAVTVRGFFFNQHFRRKYSSVCPCLKILCDAENATYITII